MTTHPVLLTTLHREHEQWAEEHRRWSREARTWLRELLAAQDHRFGYFCPSLRQARERVLDHLEAIGQQDSVVDERDFALHLYDAFNLEASQKLLKLHEQASKRHARQRHWHQVLADRIEGSLE